MAEDSMEIVLESSNSHVPGNEHDDADDFLEIDIDLPHGFTDEDDMIEDAPQLTGMDQTDVGVSFDNTDDYMLDDDHQEVSYETNDELMYEEDGGETEAPSHSYVNVDDPIFPTFVDSTTPGNNNRETNNQTFEQDGPTALTTTSVSLDTTRTGSPLPLNEESDPLDDPRDGVHPQYEDVEKFAQDDHEHVEYENVSYHGEENEGEGLTETVEQGQWEDNYTEGMDGEELDSNHDSATPEQQGIHDEAGLRQIKVWYQNTAYQLFDNGSGDPEQYFLDDLWLSVPPIKTIIQGISQVIGGELGDDEEICLHFRDFGLEIEESTCENVNISLAVILNMHKRFIENGDPADLSEAYEQNPLCIYLATRARFEDRFQKLYDGAAEKKSLTDTLARHVSENPDENENGEHDDTVRAEGVLNEELNQERVDGANVTADDKSIVADGETVTDSDVKVKVDTAAQQHEGDRSLVGHEEQTESKELYADADEAVTGDETEGSDEKVNEFSSSILLDDLALPGEQDAASPLAETINNGQAQLVNGTAIGEVEAVANHEEALGGIVQVTETVTSGHSPKSKQSEAAKSVSENQENPEELEDWEEDFQEVAQNPHVAKHLNGIAHFIPPCILPQNCVCPECAERFRAECAELNEQMDRRSSARSAELRLLFESDNDYEHTQFGLIDRNDTNSSYLDVDVDEDEESHKTEDHPYDESYAQHDDTIIDATSYSNHGEEGGSNDSFDSAADEIGVDEVDVNPPIDDDEIDFGLDDDEPHNKEPENATIFENDEIPIAWSSAAGIKSELPQTEADLVDNTASTGTLSANGENQSKVDEDEITYDDDDLEPDLRTPVKTEFPSLSDKDASTKRSWEEAEDEHDASTSIVGDAKRIRA